MKKKNDKKFPKYSVLMSVYYKEKPEWLEYSIESMMQQTVKCDEFVLVEDGPLNAGLDKIIEKYKRRYPEIFNVIKIKENGGLGPALKLGVEKCKNEIIIRMDSDDYSVPNRCEKLLAVIVNNPNYDCVGSFEAEFEKNIDDVISIHKVPEKSDDISKFMRRRCALLHPTVLVKKSSIIKSGNYRDVKLYEDYDLFMRMVCENNAKCYNIQETLYFIRINSDFYKRRGGWRYMITVLKFKNQQRKNGYMSLKDFIISAGGQAAVCLMPNFLRRWVYLKFLR